MRFLADENISRASLLELRRAGHDVASASEDCPGESDEGILRKASDD
jgi:hypothetical protein